MVATFGRIYKMLISFGIEWPLGKLYLWVHNLLNKWEIQQAHKHIKILLKL